METTETTETTEITSTRATPATAATPPTAKPTADPDRASLLERVRESRRDLEEAQRIARVGSWTLDPATGGATWSTEMFRILGLDPDGEAIALPEISQLYTAESVEAVTAAVQRAIATGEPWSMDLEMIGPDGTGRGWVTSNGVVERARDGTVAKLRGTMQDVTDQRRLESQLRQSQRLEAIGQLAGGIAHDFNNLLTAIRGYAELAREDLEEGGQGRADIDQVIQAAERATNLTRQLLAFSRRQVLQPRAVDPSEVVLGIAPMLQRLLGEHVALVAHAPVGAGRMRVDPSQLEQVILNLALNARDAMPDGGRLTIETQLIDLDDAYAASHPDTLAGPYVALIVTDTGTGMDAATKARIFEPFFTTKEPGRGTGMGLATVYGIVRQSGGSIYVYSEPGVGSTFKILLPRADPDDAADTPEPIIANLAGSGVVLLVEDEDSVRMYAARVLADLGYTLLQASAGSEALALARRHRGPIDLLITDVTMPGMQGHQLATRLRADRPDLPVLYISGFTSISVDRPDVFAGGAEFLAKPFAGESLGRAVREVLQARG